MQDLVEETRKCVARVSHVCRASDVPHMHVTSGSCTS